jgi:hypothetical protein
VRRHTWQSLNAATLRRQFPPVGGVGRAGVLELVGRVGPIQSQAARAPFLTVSSRLPGAAGSTVTSAYEAYDLVRSTSLRGTVHTSIRSQHGPLDALARRSSLRLWSRTLKLSAGDVDRLRERLEAFTADEWLPHPDLNERAVGWLAAEGFTDAVAASGSGVGSALFRGHSALLRRPLTGGWHQQGRYGYRTAAAVLGDPPVHPDDAVTELTRAHLAAFGPATRHDIAWWTGAGLRQVDAAIQRLGAEIVALPGPDDLDYLDLAEPPRGGDGDPGIRLLPEYDALLLGYAPRARVRFADPALIAFSWNRANGVHSPTVLADGRLRATWRLDFSGRRTRLRVRMAPGERRLDEAGFSAQASAVGAALGLEIEAVEVTPAGR